MPTKNILRMLVALQAALWIGQRVSISLSAPRLFGEFAASLADVSPLSARFGSRVDLLAFLILFIGLVGAGIGLCAFSNVARPLYAGVNLISILVSIVHGPLVRSGSMDFFHSANVVLTGVIFMMIYSSPLKEQYDGLNLKPAPATPAPPRPHVAARRVLFCPACGTANDGTKFCTQCGKSFL